MASEKAAGSGSGGRASRRRAAAADPKKRRADDAVSIERAHDGAVTAKKATATRSRRDEEEAEDEKGNIVQRTGGGLVEYFEGVRSEFQKTTWPSREDTRRLTIIVLIALVISSIVLGAIAFMFTELFRIGLDIPVLLFGVMALGIVGGIVFNRVTTRKTTTY
jgi:preprotein translocase subunit SecE